MKRLLLISLCLAAQVCHAAPETNSVFGIPLNEKLKVPECQSTESQGEKNYAVTIKDACYEMDKNSVGTGSNSGKTFLKVRFPKLLIIVKDSVVSVAIDGTIRDGKVGSVHFKTNGIPAAANVFMALKQRYGTPSHINTRAVKDKAGAIFQAYDADWISDTVVVVFHSVTSSLEEGEVSTFTPKAWEEAQKRTAV